MRYAFRCGDRYRFSRQLARLLVIAGYADTNGYRVMQLNWSEVVDVAGRNLLDLVRERRAKISACSVSANRKPGLSALPLTKGASCRRPLNCAGCFPASLTMTMPGDAPWLSPDGRHCRQRRLQAGGPKLIEGG